MKINAKIFYLNKKLNPNFLRIPERYLAAKYHNSVESNLLLIRKRSNLEYVIMTPKPV